MIVKKILKKIFPHPLKTAYFIGFLNNSNLELSRDERYEKVIWIDNPKPNWYADPFIFSNSKNHLEVFVEEMKTEENRGVITKLCIDKQQLKVVNKKQILSLTTHLSFPIFINDEGKTFVYPENSQSGSVKIYEYDEIHEELINPKEIINEPLLDTQIVKIKDTYYAFGVKFETGHQTDTKTLYIYKSETLTGSYKYIQKITNSKCEERGAGLIFYDNNGHLIRPAQCCEGGYGKAVIFYELKLVNGLFSEKEIERLEPNPNAKKGHVLHTFNQSGDLCVIDGLRVYHPHIGKIYRKLRNIPEY